MGTISLIFTIIFVIQTEYNTIQRNRYRRIIHFFDHNISDRLFIGNRYRLCHICIFCSGSDRDLAHGCIEYISVRCLCFPVIISRSKLQICKSQFTIYICRLCIDTVRAVCITINTELCIFQRYNRIRILLCLCQCQTCFCLLIGNLIGTALWCARRTA